jgi:ABC-type transport system involved in multi-copper enzyme maturation permease subunit
MRLLLDQIGRLLRRPASWVTFGLIAGLMAFVFIVIGATAQTLEGAQGSAAVLAILTFPGAYEAVLGFLVGLGGLLAVVYGAAIAGSEWTWGTLKNAIARGESRAGYVIALFAAIALVLALGLVLAMAVGVVAAFAGATLAGIPTDGLSDSATLSALPEKLARGWLGITEAGAIGFAIATFTRSQLAGIGVGIATYFGEQFSTIFFPDIVKYLPFHAAEAVIGVTPGFGDGGPGGPPPAQLSADVALVVVIIWLIGAVAFSAAVTQRAEISG